MRAARKTAKRRAPKVFVARGAERADIKRRRYERAWDDFLYYGPQAGDATCLIEKGVWPERRESSPWNTFRRLAHTRTGRIVILAPVIGAVGAWFLYRRKAEEDL